MTLSERLEQARLQRLDAERAKKRPPPGLAPEPDAQAEQAPEPEQPVELKTEWWESTSSRVDLPQTQFLAGPAPGLRSVVNVEPIDDDDAGSADVRMSTHERCPNCNRFARIDIADLVGGITHYSCESCGAMWQRRSVELVESRAEND